MGGEREEIFKKISNELADVIPDGRVRETILALINIIEEDVEIIRQLKEEIQRLRDENSRLKRLAHIHMALLHSKQILSLVHIVCLKSHPRLCEYSFSVLEGLAKVMFLSVQRN